MIFIILHQVVCAFCITQTYISSFIYQFTNFICIFNHFTIVINQRECSARNSLANTSEFDDAIFGIKITHASCSLRLTVHKEKLHSPRLILFDKELEQFITQLSSSLSQCTKSWHWYFPKFQFLHDFKSVWNTRKRSETVVVSKLPKFTFYI